MKLNEGASVLSKISEIKNNLSMQVMGTALAVSIALTGCGNKYSENNFAENNDAEGKLSTMLKDYSTDKQGTFNSKIVSPSQIVRMENLSKEISFSLSSVPGLDKKVIFIDLDGATGVVVNETLKKLSYNTTLNYYVNWSDDKIVDDDGDVVSKNNKLPIDIVNYDRLFSLVSQYYLTKEDSHFIEENNGAYTLKPWAIMLDYDRVPDANLDKYYDNKDNNNKTFFNLYELTENDLPNQDIFLDKEDKLRDGAVLVTYAGGINQDIREYLAKLSDKGIDVKVISIDGNHVVGLDQDKYKEYNDKVSPLLLAGIPATQNTDSSTHHAGGGGVYPYWLYGNQYGYTNRTSGIGSSSLYNSELRNINGFRSKVVSNIYTRGVNAFSGLRNTGSRLASSMSSSRISGARGGIG